MKVAIVRGGGVAGLTSTTRLDAASLPDEEARVLERLVREAGLLGEPAGGAGSPSHPDEQLYAVTVEEDGRERTHHFGEADLPGGLRSLIAWVDARPESEHSVERR